MNVVQNELHFISKCCDYVKYAINNFYIYYNTLILIYTLLPEINIQSRCGNIKHNS